MIPVFPRRVQEHVRSPRCMSTVEHVPANSAVYSNITFENTRIRSNKDCKQYSMTYSRRNLLEIHMTTENLDIIKQASNNDMLEKNSNTVQTTL
jgi:hypothetical protein